MSWEELGALGELIGAGASVVLLVYIAYQIRQSSLLIAHNTRATEAASRQAFGAQDQAYLGSGLDASVLASATAKVETGETLTPLEKSQLAAQQHLNFRVFETAYYQYRKGVLDRSEWERYERIIRFVFSAPHFRDPVNDMWGRLRDAFSEDFVGEVERLRGAAEEAS